MIYLHIPFCESFCTYCGFFSVIPSSSPHPSAKSQGEQTRSLSLVEGPRRESCFEAYSDAICQEIEERRDEIAEPLSVNTLYIGGGTPSVLPLDILSRITNFLKRLARDDGPRSLSLVEGPGDHTWDEFTIEVNPEDIVQKGDEYVRGLVELGVNRISMGIQSFDDGILRWMNRRHDSATAEEAFRILRGHGINNISIDLIFGLPQLTDTLWASTIDKALTLGPEHISAYQLSVEEDSALERMIAAGRFTEATDEQCRRQYDLLCSRLGAAGYNHYEISNFALPGREAVHNSAYWRRVPYVGLGPGAHSLSAGSVRSWNSQEVPRRLKDGTLMTYSREEERLTPEDIRVERIMLPLRTSTGMPEAELRSLAGDAPVDFFLSEGVLVRCHSKRGEESLRIPEDHFFTSDDIIRQLI